MNVPLLVSCEEERQYINRPSVRSRFSPAPSHGFRVLQRMDIDSSYGLVKASRERDQLTCFLEFNWSKPSADHEQKVLNAVSGLPFIVPLLQHIGGDRYDICVFPCGFSNDTLDSMTPTRYKKCAWQLLMGLKGLHASGIVHGAIRTESAAYDESNDILVLGDFGRRDRKEWPSPELVPYSSPEVLSRAEVSAASDMWSAGVLITEWVLCQQYSTDYEIYFRDYEEQSQTFQERKQNIEDAQRRGLLLPELKHKLKDEELNSLLRGLLQMDPAKRFTAADALTQPYFESLGDWGQLQIGHFHQWVESWKSLFRP